MVQLRLRGLVYSLRSSLAGEAACVEGGFAQCVGGAFVVQQCSGDLQCFALPLVNSPGTSITCTTAADAEARISASGATGGITGDGSAAPAPAPAPSSAPSAPAPPSASAPPSAPAPTPNGNAGGAAGGDFKTQNGLDAQDQNAEFETLDADSPCTGTHCYNAISEESFPDRMSLRSR